MEVRRKPLKLFKKLKKENFQVEEMFSGIYYISKDGFVKVQIIVARELSRENHIWLNSLSEKVDVEQVTELISITRQLENLDDKRYADSLWEIVASVNKETIQRVREDENMCKALAEIMKPEIDEAFDNGRSDKGIRVFKNMIMDGMPRELAQKYAEISDALVEQALTEI